jgi:hypothetical protein
MYSNGGSFGNGSSMDLGGGNTYGPGSPARDGSQPAAAAWMFTVLIWRV